MPQYWLHHIHAISKDPVKVAEFWENILGAKRTGMTTPPNPIDDPGMANVNVNIDLNGSEIKIRVPRTPDLISESPVHRGIEHIALITDDIHGAVQELKATGVPFLEELSELPRESPDAPQHYICYFLAPDGIVVELLGNK